jgi:hypothetical protein
MVIAWGAPGFDGSKLVSAPSWLTAVHCVVERQSTPGRKLPFSSVAELGFNGDAVGSNVNSFPPLSTAVHCVLDGHAIERSARPESIELGGCDEAPEVNDPGLKTTTCPASSPATHSLGDRQASP